MKLTSQRAAASRSIGLAIGFCVLAASLYPPAAVAASGKSSARPRKSPSPSPSTSPSQAGTNSTKVRTSYKSTRTLAVQKGDKTARTFFLTGAPASDAQVGVDDDLDVYLNGVQIFEDSSGFADTFAPIEMKAHIRDTLRIVADDSFGVCRSLSPRLSLYRPDAGTFQYLGGFEEICGGAGEGTVFYDETFTIGVGRIGVGKWETVGGGSWSAGCGCDSSMRFSLSGLWPINTSTGEFFHSFDDLDIPGRGQNLYFSRTYSSLRASRDGPLGFGWAHPFGISLSNDITGEVTIHEETGSAVSFVPDGSGGFLIPDHDLVTLTKNPDGTYLFRRELPGTEFHFDSAGKLMTSTDRNGYATTFTYQADRLSAVTDEAGRSLQFAYSSNGKLASVTDPARRVVSFTYDAANNLVQATDVAGGAWEFTYSPSHLMLTMTNPRGGTVTNTFDAQNRIESQSDPVGRTTSYGYASTPEGTRTTEVDPRGNETRYEYEQLLLKSRTEAVGTPQEITTTFTHDPDTLGATSVTDPNGHTTLNTYDARGNLLTFTDPEGHTTTYTYNARNQVLTVTDPLGVTTTNTYDTNGNLTSSSTPVGGETAITEYTYDTDNPGDVATMTEPDGNTWEYDFNQNGDRARTIDPLGNATTFAYDAVGRLLSSTSPAGNAPSGDPADHTTTYVNNAFGDPTTITDPLGNVATHTYDANRNVTEIKDANGARTVNTYNLNDELTKTTNKDASGNDVRSLTTQYDLNGNLIKQTDGLGRTTSYQYDALNRRSASTDPMDRTTTYAFDPAGNVLGMTDPAGRLTSYSYDSSDRVTHIDYSDGVTPPVDLAYDAADRRVSMDDGPGFTSYAYDALGRLTRSTQEVNGNTREVGFDYDLRGNVVSIEYPGGDDVTRTYDTAGRLASITDWAGNSTTFDYDPNGNLISQVYPNGVTAESTYDSVDRLTHIAHATGSSSLLDLIYQRDKLGLLKTENADSYGYDALSRLTNVSMPNKSSAYNYDAAGQLTSIDPSGSGATTYAYDQGAQLVSATTGANTTTFEYDSQGNRIETTSPSGVPRSYVFDQANRLTSISRNSMEIANYAYNGDGLRVSKTRAGTTSEFVWNFAEGLPTLLQDGSTRYITGPGGLPLEKVSDSGEVRYFHQDQLGSTRLLTDSTGAVKASYKYDVYGNIKFPKGAEVEPLGYAGQYRDAESGLMYMRARYYDPVTAQFISRDPLADLTAEPYSYASNSPTNLVDPSGLLSFTGCFFLCLGWGGDGPEIGIGTPGIAVTHNVGPVVGGVGTPGVSASISKSGASVVGCFWLCGGGQARAKKKKKCEEPPPAPEPFYRDEGGRPRYMDNYGVPVAP